VPPTSQKSIILHFPFLPLQFVDSACFKETREVNREDITQASVFGVASCDNEELVAYSGWGVEPSSTGLGGSFGDGDFGPTHGEEVENPQIIQITHALASEHHQVGIE